MKGSNTTATHAPPLEETLKLLDPEKYYFDLKPRPSGDEYETIDSLVRDDGRSLARLIEQAQARWGWSQRDSALTTIGGYAWRVGGPAIACYVLSRRVPDISPENVALRFDTDGGISEAALIHQRFAVLPQDPAADHPDAVVLGDEAALLEWMRGRLIAGVAPRLEAAREHVRIGRRAAWAQVSDYAGYAFLMVGWDAGDQARYAADAKAFLTGLPLKGRTGLFVVEIGDRRGAYLTRGVCCRAYKDPAHDNCDYCPMLTQEERERRALADLVDRT